MRADNTDRLPSASPERGEQTERRAAAALKNDRQRVIHGRRLAIAAGVSRSWIYTQPTKRAIALRTSSVSAPR